MSVRGGHCDYSIQAPKSLFMPRTTEFCCSFVPMTHIQKEKLDPSPLLFVNISGSHDDELDNPQILRKSNRTPPNTQSLGQHGFY